MDAARWKETRAIFDELVDLTGDRRASRLAAIESGDPEMCAALERLLAADALSSGALDAPASCGAPDLFGLSGRMLSHFRVLEPLGAGGMGVVYRAEDTRLGRVVALKLPLPHFGFDAAARARFLREARSAAALDHPNLCTIHEVGESDDGRLFLAMPLYAGETLRARLDREGPLPIQGAVEVARQLARGLVCAHAAGIVHRDLKPGNVMLLPDGMVKILDFGLARVRDVSLTGSGATLGTVAYMAPEQLRGEVVDTRADLWALGVVLYEMLTGERPFPGEDQQTVMHGVLHTAPAPPSSLRTDLPAALDGIVLRLLEKSPGERYAGAEDLLQALSGIPPSTIPTPPSAPRRRRGPFPRPGRRSGVIAVATLFLLAAVWSVRELRPDAPDPQHVVVAVFEDQTGDPEFRSLGRLAADQITQGLAKSGYLRVTDARAIPEVWNDSASSPADIRFLAEATGAGTLIEGRIYLDGDSLRFHARITDARDGHVVRGLDPVVAPRAAPVLGVERLTDQVMTAVGLTLDRRIAPWESGSRARVPSFAAYRAYSAGMDAYNRPDYLTAAPDFERAIALDTTFLAAGIWAALSRLLIPWTDSGPRDEHPRHLALADSMAAEIQRRSHLLEPYDREFFDFYLAARRSDWAGCYAAAKRMWGLAPGSVVAMRELAITARRDDRPREALELLEQLGMERGLLRYNVEDWARVLITAHRLGDYEREVRYARKAREIFPDSPPLILAEVRALAAMGELEEAERLRDQSLDVIPGVTLHNIGIELRAHGHQAASRRSFERALRYFRSLPREDQEEPAELFFTANVLFMLGREAEARPLYERVPRETLLSAQARGRLGVIAVRAGDLATARRIYDQLAAESILLPQRDWGFPLARATIAAALGDRGTAVTHARDVDGTQRWQYLHFHPDLEPLRGYPPFDALMRAKG